jgi:hypothetical protein
VIPAAVALAKTVYRRDRLPEKRRRRQRFVPIAYAVANRLKMTSRPQIGGGVIHCGIGLPLKIPGARPDSDGGTGKFGLRGVMLSEEVQFPTTPRSRCSIRAAEMGYYSITTSAGKSGPAVPYLIFGPFFRALAGGSTTRLILAAHRLSKS